MVEATNEFAELSLALVDISMSAASRSNAQRQRVLDVVHMEEEIHASARQSSLNSRQTCERTEAMAEQADAGHITIEQSMLAMQEMVNTVADSAGLMREFVDSMQEITRIVDTINEIARQTNFLALNAAIEAAHAGVHGDGFNVIAQEIRGLADRATQSTNEVGERIKHMSQSALRAETAMQIGRRAAQDSIVQNAAVQQVFQTIRGAVHEVQRMSSEVAAASDRQLAAGEKVTGAVREIDRMAEDCTMEADASAEMSIRLTESAAFLEQIVAAAHPRHAPGPGRDKHGAGPLLSRIARSRPAVERARKDLQAKFASISPTVKGTTQIGDLQLPALFLGAVSADRSTPWIDALDERTGCRATIFVRQGDTFTRVATSVRRPDGQRAIGTRLNPKGRAIRELLKKQPFEGVVYVLGKPSFAAYDPLLSPTGEVIGASFVGQPLSP